MELLDSVDLMLHDRDFLVELFLGDSKGVAVVWGHLSSALDRPACSTDYSTRIALR